MTRIKLVGNENDIIKRYNSGESTQQIADTYGVSRSAVERCLTRCGIALKCVRIDLDIGRIIEMYNSGVSQNAIAKEFGVSRPVINRRLKEAGNRNQRVCGGKPTHDAKQNRRRELSQRQSRS